MNDQDFILLMEQYLDGSLSVDGRAALRAELTTDPARRHLFEQQARQHVRIHAQTSRVDFTESQRIAMMVVDIAEKHHEPAHFADLLREQTLRERFQAIRRGLRTPRGSAPNRYARFAIVRMFTPPAVSLTIAAAVILTLIIWVPRVMRPWSDDNEIIRIDLTPERDPQPLDKTPPQPTAESETETATISTTQTPPTPTPPDIDTHAPPAHPTPIPVPPTGPTGLPIPVPRPPTFQSPPGVLSNRTAEVRTNILKTVTNSPLTERAVTKALDWLAAHQLKDGSWAGQDPAAMTGLAILTYLAHAEVPGTQPYGDTVANALKFLIARQDSEGYFSRNAYAHAIAVYAVSEAFALTRIVELREPMEKGVERIVAGQQSGGGFDYNYNQGTRFDTSVSGWQIQALKAAFIAGAATPGLPAALDKAAQFLQKQAFSRDGSGFVYDGQIGAQPVGKARWTMTGVGTLCLQFLGKPNARELRLGLRALQDVSFDWLPAAKPSLYGYYYVTQAKFQQSNTGMWHAWNKQMQTVLLKRQHTDGHWENGDYDQGTHVYTTTLCTMMLEVYYRYLPTFGKVQVQEASAPSNDVPVDVQ